VGSIHVRIVVTDKEVVRQMYRFISVLSVLCVLMSSVSAKSEESIQESIIDISQDMSSWKACEKKKIYL